MKEEIRKLVERVEDAVEPKHRAYMGGAIGVGAIDRCDAAAVCAAIREMDAEIEKIRASSECQYSSTGYCGACDICCGNTSKAHEARIHDLEAKRETERSAWLAYVKARNDHEDKPCREHRKLVEEKAGVLALLGIPREIL